MARLLVEFRDWSGSSQPSVESMGSSVQRLIADSQSAFLLIAPRAIADPVGVCQLRFRLAVWTGVEDCWLEDVFVRESERGAGLGRALVDAACEHARRRGCVRIELDVNSDNGAAYALYEGVGFSARSKGMGSADSRDVLMGLRLAPDDAPSR